MEGKAAIDAAIEIGMTFARERLGDELQAGIIKVSVDPVLAIMGEALRASVEHYANRPVSVEGDEGAEIVVTISP